MDLFARLLVLVSAASLLIGLTGRLVKARLPVSWPLLLVAAGAFVGPAGIGWFDPFTWSTRPHVLLEEAARLAVGAAVMAAALRLPRGVMRPPSRSVVLALTAGMLGMWVVSATLAWWLLPLSTVAALLAGAIVTPTDPVIAGAITTGTLARHAVAGPLRTTMSAEAGANDGGALPFVMLPVLLLQAADAAWTRWAIEVVLRGVVLAIVVGAVLGLAVAAVQRWADRHALDERTDVALTAVALALLTLGALRLLESDGVLGVFVAGLVYRRYAREEDEAPALAIQEHASHLFAWPTFLLFGMMLPWEAWRAHAGTLALLAILTLLLRRPPVFLALARAMPDMRAPRDRWFFAWFGPIGLAAVLYGTMTMRLTGDPLYWTTTSALVAASVLVHGVTATPCTRWYARSAREE